LALSAIAQIGWQAGKVKANGDLVAVYFTSAEKGWIAGDAGYLASTTDGGKNWSKYPLNSTEDINEIYFRNEDNGYLVAGKKMFITRDAGRSWQETRIYKATDFKTYTPEFLSIRFADKKRGFVIGSLLNNKEEVVDSLLMRTEDGGDTWRRVLVPSKLELFHLDFDGNSRGWIVGDTGLILASTDGGVTWRTQTSGVTRALFNVDFRDDSEGYAVGGGGTILRTENGGATWEKVVTSFPKSFKRVDFADDKNGWIVGFDGTILRSSDKGRTWIKQDSKTTENLYGLYIVKKYGWAVGANGAILEYVR
jgi:photosystem II stability/assembly factor-like uncharacterized protein